MAELSKVQQPPAPSSTRTSVADDLDFLTQLLHRAHRACTQSRAQSRELCHRTAILQHSGRGPPQASEQRSAN
ncbi:MAG: hypothetical protein SFW65_00555 [Alphaproteobacteria bacterium]|nr:hypothetical protein [Alphaproteobacteria bacterium]